MRAFSAGVDIKDHTRAKVPEMLEAVHGVIRTMLALPQITIAAITGACVALGIALKQLVQFGALKKLPMKDYVVATSVGITAHVLASRGLLNARASRVILAAAIIDDVLGLIVLSIVSSVATGQFNWVDLVLTAVIASGFTVFIALWGNRAVRRVVPHVQARMQVAEAEFALAMALMFGLSLLAAYAGVAAIVGAFLAGMALSETVDKRVLTMTAGVSELLVPFFLAGIGISTFAVPAWWTFRVSRLSPDASAMTMTPRSASRIERASFRIDLSSSFSLRQVAR